VAMTVVYTIAWGSSLASERGVIGERIQNTEYRRQEAGGRRQEAEFRIADLGTLKGVVRVSTLR
jgi:hypothetical protein